MCSRHCQGPSCFLSPSVCVCHTVACHFVEDVGAGDGLHVDGVEGKGNERRDLDDGPQVSIHNVYFHHHENALPSIVMWEVVGVPIPADLLRWCEYGLLMCGCIA